MDFLTSTTEPMDSLLQWVPHGSRAMATQRENDMALMLGRILPQDRAVAARTDAAASLARAHATELALECVHAGVEVERATVAKRAAHSTFVAAVARECNAVAAVRRFASLQPVVGYAALGQI